LFLYLLGTPYRKQDYRKQYTDKCRTSGYRFIIGDRVWVNKHPLNSSARQRTSKFIPRYVILSQRSPTTFEVANLEDPDVLIGVYHTSALRLNQGPSSKPLAPLR
ncbi:uncharacterized protein TNIN_179631, partial [Trichonephila inaurata madagascariensis]